MRELIQSGVRVDETFDLVLQECSNLTRVEFCECVDRDSYNPIVEALRESKVESLALAFLNPLTPFEAHILGAARGFMKLNKLKLGVWPDDRAELAFVENYHRTLT